MYKYAQQIENELESRGESNSSISSAVEETKEYWSEVHEKEPGQLGLGTSNAGANHSVDDIIGDAQGFLNAGNNGQSTLNGQNLIEGSRTLSNILLAIGIFLAVAIGMYLGAKFMTSSVEEKAKVKEMLIPYIVGCVVIFGAFIIWKLVISLIGGIGL